MTVTEMRRVKAWRVKDSREDVVVYDWDHAHYTRIAGPNTSPIKYTCSNKVWIGHVTNGTVVPHWRTPDYLMLPAGL